MLTERQIHHASGKYARENHEGELTRDDFRAGATWANEQNADEIAELVAALKRLNGVCRDNFGIGDPQVSELLKKYEK